MRLAIGATIVGILCFNTNLSAQPDKQLYELQQRCGRFAKEVFDREYSPRIGYRTRTHRVQL